MDRRNFIKNSVAAGLGTGFGIGAYLGMGMLGGAEKSGTSRLPASHGERRFLATPHERLKDEYQVLIVGSGYGGSILGARLATQSKSVCIFERGKEWLPGDFPTSFSEVQAGARGPLNPLGLVEWNADPRSDLDIIAGCGLGGTSLLNAAITIRPEDLVFEQRAWPREIREEKARGELDPYYVRAENVLGATQDAQTRFAMKARIHAKSSGELGVPWGELKLNVNHSVRDGAMNAYGVSQSACTLCGDCCSGCNVGAKNSTNFNYLPLAKGRGADIFTGMEVTGLEKATGGYKVYYTYHRGGLHAPFHGTVRAKNVILSAGSMGTTEILLRSKRFGLPLSRRVGSRLSINGDVLGFSYAGRYQTDILGFPGTPAGQAIQSYADYRASARTGAPLDERFLLLDGTVPTSMAPMIAKALAAFAMLEPGHYSDEQMLRIKSDLQSSIPARGGALNHSMLYLACGHDSSGGEYRLTVSGEHVHALWPGMRSEHGFNYVNEVMAEHTRRQGGRFIPNPRTTVFGGKRLMGTHPLGGAPMGDNADEGAVDHRGRVYDGQGGIHQGLYVADGSMIPHSLGATPLITISALSERIAEKIIEAGEI